MHVRSSIRSLLLAGVAASVAMVSLSQATEIIFRSVDSMGGSIIETEALALSFAPASNLLFGAVPLSEPARFTGPSSSYPVGLTRLTATGGQIRICEDASCTSGTAWSSTAPVRNGQYVQARAEALTTPGQRASVKVTSGGLSASFEATARSSPASFGSLASVTRSPGIEGESGLSTFNGWVSTAVTASGGDVRICQSSGACTDWVASGTVRDGDEVQLRGVAGAFGETRTVTASAGGATARFDVVTRAKDTTPDAIAFGTGPTDVEPASTSTTPVVTLAGFDDAPISISGTGARYSLNGSAFTASAGTARPGDTVRVELVAGAFGERRTATLTVGGAQSTWSSTVRARDLTPDAVANFTSLTNQTAGATVVSNVQQLRNHDGVTASVTGSNARMRVCTAANCSGGTVGAWVTSASVARDQYVQLQTVVGAAGATVTASLSYGQAVAATWSVQSIAVATAEYRFTNCGATGQNGPSLANCRSAYGAALSIEMSVNGYQRWRVPETGSYRITVAGASGGNQRSVTHVAGGRGIVQSGTFSLVSGSVLTIQVGQAGSDNTIASNRGHAAGGGGGTSVYRSQSDILMVSGGGGGAAYFRNANDASKAVGLDAVQTQSGGAALESEWIGTNGSGSPTSSGSSRGTTGASGGAGFIGDSYDPTGTSSPAKRLFENGVGSTQSSSIGNGHGGFGGGGAGLYGGGGGGGYSGGSPGTYVPTDATGGGGGGSLNNGTNQSLDAFRSGDGYVVIRKL